MGTANSCSIGCACCSKDRNTEIRYIRSSVSNMNEQKRNDHEEDSYCNVNVIMHYQHRTMNFVYDSDEWNDDDSLYNKFVIEIKNEFNLQKDIKDVTIFEKINYIPSGSWKCINCENINNIKSPNCQSCAAIKSDNIDPIESEYDIIEIEDMDDFHNAYDNLKGNDNDNKNIVLHLYVTEKEQKHEQIQEEQKQEEEEKKIEIKNDTITLHEKETTKQRDDDEMTTEIDTNVVGENDIDDSDVAEIAFKKCPNVECGIYIKNVSNDKHMKCIECLTEFCWDCLQILEPKKWKTHFLPPKYDKCGQLNHDEGDILSHGTRTTDRIDEDIITELIDIGLGDRYKIIDAMKKVNDPFNKNLIANVLLQQSYTK